MNPSCSCADEQLGPLGWGVFSFSLINWYSDHCHAFRGNMIDDWWGWIGIYILVSFHTLHLVKRTKAIIGRNIDTGSYGNSYQC